MSTFIDDNNNRIAYLEMQKTLGTATADELVEFRGSFRLVGEGAFPLVVPAHSLTVDEWVESGRTIEAADAQQRAEVAAVVMPAPKADEPVTRVIDSQTGVEIILCKPENEPKPRGRENLKTPIIRRR